MGSANDLVTASIELMQCGDVMVTTNGVATCRDATLHGHYSIERHVRTSEITLSGGGLIIVEDAYTNAPGEIVAASSTSA